MGLHVMKSRRHLKNSSQNKFIELLPNTETRIVISVELSKTRMGYACFNLTCYQNPHLLSLPPTPHPLTPARTPYPSPIAIDTLSLKGQSQLWDHADLDTTFLANFNSSYDISFYFIWLKTVSKGT